MLDQIYNSIHNSTHNSILERVGFTVVALSLWFVSQKFLGKRIPHTDTAIKDLIHELTSKVNQKLNQNSALANLLLISSSLLIDILGLFLIIWSIFGPSVKPLVGVFILFFLRQLNQFVSALPTPKGMIWRDPGFPSLFVTYGVSNDLFFSGHTALATFGALELMRFGNTALSALAILVLVYEIVIVLILRAHWTLDVFTGVVTALLVFQAMA